MRSALWSHMDRPTNPGCPHAVCHPSNNICSNSSTLRTKRRIHRNRESASWRVHPSGVNMDRQDIILPIGLQCIRSNAIGSVYAIGIVNYRSRNHIYALLIITHNHHRTVIRQACRKMVQLEPKGIAVQLSGLFNQNILFDPSTYNYILRICPQKISRYKIREDRRARFTIFCNCVVPASGSVSVSVTTPCVFFRGSSRSMVILPFPS